MDAEARRCTECDYCFMEPDLVITCGHEQAMSRSFFGINVNIMRSPEGTCGPDAKLFSPRGLR